MTQTIFDNWKPEHSQLWGQIPILQQHNLNKSPLFTDDALADLIENYPRKDYSLVVPGRQDKKHHHQWREGDIGNATGAEVLKAIKNGFLWINLRNMPLNSPLFKELAEQLFDEMKTNVPGLKINDYDMTLLVTSPGAQTYYHCDVPGQSLWHIRGRKKAYLYPATAPFMPDELLERVIMQETEEEIPFEQWFDDQATVVDLEPGMMAHWPQFSPHRVENYDSLNVSITTEYWTNEIERNYKVRYANGLLRRKFHMNPKSTDTNGMAYLSKAILQSVWRRSGLAKKHVWSRKIDFKLDPSNLDEMIDITPFHISPGNG